MRSPLRFLATLACWAVSALATAQGTGLGADSAISEVGDCQIETSFERAKKRGEADQRESAVRFGCGIGWSTELEATLARVRTGGTSERVLSLEAKTTLRDRQDGGIGWALALGIDAERLAGGHWRRSEERIELEASRQFAPAWLAEAKLGTARDRAARRHSTIWALSVEHAWSEAVEVKAELGGNDRIKPFFGVGWRRTLVEDVQFKLAWATRTGTPREQRWAASLQVEF
jgi:hypothetical protein